MWLGGAAIEKHSEWLGPRVLCHYILAVAWIRNQCRLCHLRCDGPECDVVDNVWQLPRLAVQLPFRPVVHSLPGLDQSRTSARHPPDGFHIPCRICGQSLCQGKSGRPAACCELPGRIDCRGRGKHLLALHRRTGIRTDGARDTCAGAQRSRRPRIAALGDSKCRRDGFETNRANVGANTIGASRLGVFHHPDCHWNHDWPVYGDPDCLSDRKEESGLPFVLMQLFHTKPQSWVDIHYHPPEPSLAVFC